MSRWSPHTGKTFRRVFFTRKRIYLFLRRTGRRLRKAKMTKRATDWKVRASVVDVSCWSVVPACVEKRSVTSSKAASIPSCFDSANLLFSYLKSFSLWYERAFKTSILFYQLMSHNSWIMQHIVGIMSTKQSRLIVLRRTRFRVIRWQDRQVKNDRQRN